MKKLSILIASLVLALVAAFAVGTRVRANPPAATPCAMLLADPAPDPANWLCYGLPDGNLYVMDPDGNTTPIAFAPPVGCTFCR